VPPIRLLHSLTRSPTLSIGVVATLALGVGALTATFGVVNAALLREPPFEDAPRLAMLYLERNPFGEQPRRERWSFARIRLLRESQRSFENVASYSPAAVSISSGGDPELLRGEMVSSEYFAVLRTDALRGRVFLPDEDDAGSPAPVAVVSHSLWVRRWAGDPSLVGSSIRVNGEMLTVIGILPKEFHGLSGRSEIWMPAPMAARLTYADYVRTNQNFISVVGRLRPGIALDAARGELAVLGATINRALPSNPEHPLEKVTASALSLNEARVDRGLRRSLYVLLSAVAVLHLLACANVTNLLLGRAAARRRESAVRVALGSGTWRLCRQLFAEHATPALLGGALGVALGWTISALVTPPTNVWAPRNFYGSLAPFDSPAFAGRELAFGVALAVASAFLVAMPAALTALRIDAHQEMKAGARGSDTSGITLRRPSMRGVLIAVEATLATLLVVAAGLLIDSFQRMRAAPLGVDPANVLTFWVIPSEARVPPAVAPAFVSRLVDAVGSVPGVASVTVDGGGPLSGSASSSLFIAGKPVPHPSQAPAILRHYVAPGHFRTLGIPLRRGREFTTGDVAGGPLVTIISETAARTFWPNQDPIGQRVWFSSGTASSADSSAEVVGIVGDVQYQPLDQRPNRASFYTPFTQFTYPARMVFARTVGDPLSIVAGVRSALTRVDPDLAMRDVQTLDALVNGSWARNRFDALLFAGFGAAALLLAASGIFAVLAYAVANRTREFGIRIALGAAPGEVVRMVLGEGLAFPVAGLVLGAMLSVASTRVLRASLYEVSPLEPRIYVLTTVLLLGVAVLACMVPAWHATRTDPIKALRAE
jgi:putative ABC transport system permease protein